MSINHLNNDYSNQLNQSYSNNYYKEMYQQQQNQQPIKKEMEKPLSTSSPTAIAASSMVTPQRLSNLLNYHGPLPIRHITSHLANQIPGFGQLSLSKQRRLIMSVFENTEVNGDKLFEKIGWGQWSVKSNSTSSNNSTISQVSSSVPVQNSNQLTSQEKSMAKRRESITTNNNPHNIIPPLAIESSSSSSSDIEEEENASDSDDEELFSFDDDILIKRFANRVPLLGPVTPILNSGGNNSPNLGNNGRRKSSYSVTKPKIRSRLNSIDNLEIQRRNSFGTTKQSNLRSTLVNASPISSLLNNDSVQQQDTDEEDWESIGSENLRNLLQKNFKNNNNNNGSNGNENINKIKILNEIKDRERDAAFALVELRSI